MSTLSISRTTAQLRSPTSSKADSAISYDIPAPDLRIGANGSLELGQRSHHDFTTSIAAGSAAVAWSSVTPVRCFPWSDATRFISLRDTDNQELWLVESVTDLPAASQNALMTALRVAGFLLEITAVISIEEDFEIRAWKVVTTCGHRSFQTERDSWPHTAPGGGHMMQDVAGDVFFIPPIGTLDPQSQKLLWPYVD